MLGTRVTVRRIRRTRMKGGVRHTEIFGQSKSAFVAIDLVPKVAIVTAVRAHHTGLAILRLRARCASDQNWRVPTVKTHILRLDTMNIMPLDFISRLRENVLNLTLAERVLTMDPSQVANGAVPTHV